MSESTEGLSWQTWQLMLQPRVTHNHGRWKREKQLCLTSLLLPESPGKLREWATLPTHTPGGLLFQADHGFPGKPTALSLGCLEWDAQSHAWSSKVIKERPSHEGRGWCHADKRLYIPEAALSLFFLSLDSDLLACLGSCPFFVGGRKFWQDNQHLCPSSSGKR